MATFQISDPSGATYQIDAPDAGTAMTAFTQMKGAPPTPPPDKYQQAAATTLSSLKGTPADPSYGPGDSFVNGMTFGALPTIMGALDTPGQMISHGTLDPTEGYAYAKALENAAKASGDATHPIANTLADIGGGGMTGAGLAHAGVTAVGEGAGLLGRIAGSAVDGAGQGAASGFLSGEGDERFSGAGQGALLGGALGAAVPAAAGIAKGVAAAPMANIAGRLGPQQAAQSPLARAIMNSGKTPEELQAAIDNATAAGQPNYTLADALGKPGADTLSNVVRSPGEAGTQAAAFLDARQAAQGRDVAGQLSQGLGVNQTANQLSDALTAQRGADADVNYGAARSAPGASAVDVSPAIQAANSILTPGVTRFVSPNSNIADNSVESAVRRARSYLTDGNSQLTNFNDVLSAKQEIDNMIEAGTPTIQRALMPMKRALDNAMIDASPAYQGARDTFAQQSRAIDAIPQGRAAARSGRPEDTIPVYQGIDPAAQAAYRTGYADPLLEQASNGNPMANKVLPLSNDGTQQELAAMSQYQGPLQPGANDQLVQALTRSNDMNATFRRARTGSQTFDNLAEGSQEGVDPGVLWEAARGNWHGVALDFMRKAANAYSGSTPEVRSHLAQALLMRGPAADVSSAVAPRLAAIQYRENLARALGAATRGGLAISAGESTSGRHQ
jgi:hypothetical protein